MAERGILFSAPMVRALLDGSKTQTRRVVKPRDLAWMDEHQGLREPCNAERCPYGTPGGRLWVRETWASIREDKFGPLRDADSLIYLADDNEGWDGKWRPAIHMFRWASRITLEVTSVRVERLQDISVEDCRAEGGMYDSPIDVRAWYRDVWESINGAGSWDANPWVWCISFKRVQP